MYTLYHTGKSIDETTAAGDLDGTYVRQEAHTADRFKLGYASTS